jgi:LmbE family N-acetylglucosaminyl deacetylase
MGFTDVLVLVAHADDEVLGPGGTVHRLTRTGCTVRVALIGQGGIMARQAVGKPEDARKQLEALKFGMQEARRHLGYGTLIEAGHFPDNRMDTVARLDVVQTVESILARPRISARTLPEVVLTYSPTDLNVDHRITVDAVITATRPGGKYPLPVVASFEVPSSTEWQFTGSRFIPDIYVSLEEEDLGAKLAAMTDYPSELRDYPHPRSVRALDARARVRGSECGKQAAEAFMLLRGIL